MPSTSFSSFLPTNHHLFSSSVQVFVRSYRLLHILHLYFRYCYSSRRGSLLPIVIQQLRLRVKLLILRWFFLFIYCYVAVSTRCSCISNFCWLVVQVFVCLFGGLSSHLCLHFVQNSWILNCQCFSVNHVCSFAIQVYLPLIGLQFFSSVYILLIQGILASAITVVV